MSKHIHADLITEYARLSHLTDRPWEHFEYKFSGDWLPETSEILFLPDRGYRLKPRTVRIGKFDIPEPVREPLEDDTRYYCPYIGIFGNPWGEPCRWEGSEYDLRRLKNGLIHLDRESAELHAQALISLTQK